MTDLAFALHLGNGVYLDSAGNIHHSPAPATVIYEAEFKLPIDPQEAAEALLTHGRQQRPRRSGEAGTDPAGSETPGRHGNSGCGTRETLCLTWSIAARSAR